MPLFIAPLQLKDFDTIIAHANIYLPGDDLVAPPTPVAWPVSTREDAQKRLSFTMAKQRRRFVEDDTVRFMKVVDASSKKDVHDSTADIVSVARWHFFPTGYDFASMSHWEVVDQLPGEDWPTGLNRQLHDFVLLSRDEVRKDWIGIGKPVWCLMHMVTRQSQRGRGAAGMLIRWGIEQSERDGVPAYLEAGSAGKPVYEKYGFEQVGNLQELDLSPFGLDIKFSMAHMVRQPSKDGSSHAITVEQAISNTA